MILIDGKQVSEIKKKELASQIVSMIDNGKRAPHLAAVIVGDDPASLTYVKNKEKAAHSIGMMSSVYRYPASIAENELLSVIDFLNLDEEVDGFIVQLPLPLHVHPARIIERIYPSKDVDGFHPVNMGRMVQSLPVYIPATPYGIIQLLEYYNIHTAGKHCVVLGRSNIVGTPVSILLSRKAKPGNCTVTICHSQTQNLGDITRQADIIIAAMGVPKFVKASMVKEGVVVIDVGIHRIEENGQTILAGDVDFIEVSKKASAITPVPGGVGPMTIIGLLQNTLKAARKEIY